MPSSFKFSFVNLLIALENFGADRGQIAHSTRAQQNTTPEDALNTVNHILSLVDSFDGFVNIVTLKARKYNGTTCEDAEIYDDKKSKVFELHNTMVEAVAQTSDELLDKFFGGEPLTHEEIQNGLRVGVLDGELIPVLVGSATKNIGIHTALQMFKYCKVLGEIKAGTGQALKVKVFLGNCCYRTQF